jgi:hypothetical protein
MGFSGPKYEAPPPVPLPPPAAHPAVLGSQNAISAGAKSPGSGARAGAAAASQDGTIATSPAGVTEQPTTARATLLGQ